VEGTLRGVTSRHPNKPIDCEATAGAVASKLISG